MANKQSSDRPVVALMDKTKAWFYRQPSQNRKAIKKYGTLGGAALVALGIYYGTGQDHKKAAPPAPAITVPATDNKTVHDDVVVTLEGKISDLGKDIDKKVTDAVSDAISNGDFKLNPALAGQHGQSDSQGAPDNLTKNTPPQTPAASNPIGDYPSAASYPPPVPMPSNDTGQQNNGKNGQNHAPGPEWVGDISDEEGTGIQALDRPSLEGNAAKKNLIQLPVGFMKARLLVGVNALTGEFGSENPQTVMFRVQTPAQLPNNIRMNLRGCFTVANVNGNLSSERIIVLPVSMHCITMDGKTIVEGNVKGFVSDRDGKRDMSGRIVSRAGRLLASAVFAKTAEGFANTVSAQGVSQNVSALGSVNTIKTDQLAKTSVATGLGGGVSEVSKYLLKLAEQTAPALETGPGKDVNLFIQETATLEIKEVRIK